MQVRLQTPARTEHKPFCGFSMGLIDKALISPTTVQTGRILSPVSRIEHMQTNVTTRGSSALGQDCGEKSVQR